MTPRSWPSSWCVPLAVLLVSLLAPPGAHGDEGVAVCTPGDPSECSQPLEEGESAPFRGQLLTPKLAIKLGQQAAGCQDRIKVEVDYATKMSGIDLTLERKTHEIDLAAWKQEKAVMMAALEEAKKPTPWYEKPAFVATISVLLTAAATYGMFELATHAAK